MKKRFLIILSLLFLGLCLTFYIINTFSSKTTNEIINLEGKSTLWKSSINISLNYDSELNIRPRRDDFIIPFEIDIDIINNKSVYTDKLEYIKDPHGFLLGKYTVKINSKDYFNKRTKEVSMIIKYNDETSTIVLKRKQSDK